MSHPPDNTEPVLASPLVKIEAGVISKEEPWQDDRLKRDEFASHLTAAIATIQQPFTIGIESAFGTGKSYFLQRWKAQLRNEGYATVYFNTWETDFSHDPLAAFITSIEEQLVEKKNAPVKKKINALIRAAGPLVTKGLVKKAIGAEEGEALLETTGISEDDLANQMESVVRNRLNTQKKSLEAVKSFQQRLSQLASAIPDRKGATGRPKVIILVDELDRCRPSYAIEMLEHIKHFFAVPEIVFVVAVDRAQLQATLAGKYGSRFDSNGYLRRFFDIWIPLPDPSWGEFALHLANQFKLVEDGILDDQDSVDRSVSSLTATFSRMSEALKIPLREQEQIFTEINLSLRSLPSKQVPFAAALGVIAIARHREPDLCRSYCLGTEQPHLFVQWFQETVTVADPKFPIHRLPTWLFVWGMNEQLSDEIQQESYKPPLKGDLVNEARTIWRQQWQRYGHFGGTIAEDIYRNLEYWGAPKRN